MRAMAKESGGRRYECSRPLAASVNTSEEWSIWNRIRRVRVVLSRKRSLKACELLGSRLN